MKGAGALFSASLIVGICGQCAAGELSVEDFRFDGPLGSQGAKIEKLDRNHFKVTLGHAPNNPGWPNHLQFHIPRNAKGNDLRIIAQFVGETGYAFTGNFSSWSYDGKDWQRIPWSSAKFVKDGDTKTEVAEIAFPPFEQDTVWFGFHVPMTYEDMVALIDTWKKHPAVKVHLIGRSLGNRNLYRLEITDPDGPHPRPQRWVHYFANQHPGEFNSMWRMAGMVDWLLSDEGADARKRFICHFILMMSPDGPAAGWHRVNAQGIDMNRSYARQGANEEQGHEPFLWQRDLESIMASDCPATTIWSMHVWPGAADPNMAPGPETDNLVGPPAHLAEILKRNDPDHVLVKPLRFSGKIKPRSKPWTPLPAGEKPKTTGGGASWSGGPGLQFGVTNFLCEGGGNLYTKKENVDSGMVIMKSLAEYYAATKAAPPKERPAATQGTPEPAAGG